MGFLSGIFKKKKGGTLVGNLLRGGASAMTGGLLGSGQGLANWEAEQAREQQQALSTLRTPQYNPNQGIDIGRNLVNNVAVPAMANGGGNSPKVGENVIKETLKNKWYMVVGALGAVVAVTYFITRKSTKPKVK